MNRDQAYMYRCLQLALLGEGTVAPNPMVGAVLVHDDKIIGEGYHKKHGEAHAEVNCIHSVKENHRSLIPFSTLYVSLEPCAHFGKTPPCVDLIIQQKIPRVVIGCRDPFVDVNGKGIEKLRSAGVEVGENIVKKQSEHLNRRFFCFHTKKRPYIILKWAQTKDRKIGYLPVEDLKTFRTPPRLYISSEYANRLVHRWRSKEMAIMIGTNTALQDDPQLTTRLAPGPDPLRLVIDLDLKLPQTLKIFDGISHTIILNYRKHEEGKVFYYKLEKDISLIPQIMHGLHSLHIQSVMIEGGARLLQSFIDEDIWDEARVITNEQFVMGSGLSAPLLKNEHLMRTESCFSDSISYYLPRQVL